MQTRSRSAARLPQTPQHKAANAGTTRRSPRNTQTCNVSTTLGQQQPAAAKSGPGGSTRQTRTRGSAALEAQSTPTEQQAGQPLEALADVAEAYFSAHSDTEVLEAAQGVARIWLLQDTSIRARLSCVLGPVLAREERLAERAAAVAAKKQARRAKVAEQEPRVSTVAAAAGRGLHQQHMGLLQLLLSVCVYLGHAWTCKA